MLDDHGFMMMIMTPKMCSSRDSMHKLLMSHLMGFNGTQSGPEEIYQQQKEGAFEQ